MLTCVANYYSVAAKGVYSTYEVLCVMVLSHVCQYTSNTPSLNVASWLYRQFELQENQAQFANPYTTVRCAQTHHCAVRSSAHNIICKWSTQHPWIPKRNSLLLFLRCVVIQRQQQSIMNKSMYSGMVDDVVCVLQRQYTVN